MAVTTLLKVFGSILGRCSLGTGFRLDLIAKVPVVKVADADAYIGGEAEPGEIGSEQPGGELIDLAPDVGEIAHGARQGDDVDCC